MKTNIVESLFDQLREIGFPECQLDHADYKGAFRQELTRKVKACIETSASCGKSTLFRMVCYGNLKLAPVSTYIGFEFLCKPTSMLFNIHKVYVYHKQLFVSNSVDMVKTVWEPAILSRAIIKLVSFTQRIESSKRQYALLLAVEKMVIDLVNKGYMGGRYFEAEASASLAEQLRTLIFPLCDYSPSEPVTRFASVQAVGCLLDINEKVAIKLNFLYNSFTGNLQSHSLVLSKDDSVYTINTPDGRLFSIAQIAKILSEYKSLPDKGSDSAKL